MTPLAEHRTMRSSGHHDELLSQRDIVSKLILFGAALLSLVLLAVTAAYPQPAANQNASAYTEAELDQTSGTVAALAGSVTSTALGRNGHRRSTRRD
jgi:hypothetical protein